MEEKQVMFMSAEIDQIAAALSEFQSELKQPELSKEVSVKTRTGGTYTFKYADLSTCVKAAVPAMKKCGLAVTQVVVNSTLVTILAHKSGQWFRSEIEIKAPADYQALGSAITYLKRYTYCAILGIVADTDDDANAACGNEATFKEPAKRASSKKSSGATAVAFKGDVLKQALADLEAAKTNEEYAAVWQKYSTEYPAMCQKGTEFYEACIKKANELQQS
ncbi:MAG: ERF family protein [Muribaculaceae bacterium]|nr:ERF family protein [Muribaculaceae bacterium]